MTSIIKGQNVRVEEAPEGGRTPGGCAPKQAEPVRLDGRVAAIRFTCSCGEVSLIELDYDGGAPAPEDA